MGIIAISVMRLNQFIRLFFITIALLSKANAQSPAINSDSLVLVANSITVDTAKVIQYFKFAALCAHSPNLEKRFEDSALAISKRINYEKGLLRAYRNLSGFYWRIEDYSKAIEYNSYRKAIAIEMRDSMQLASSYNTEGLSYASLGEYSKALQAYEAGIQVYKQLGNEKLAVFLQGNVAAVYLSLKNYSKAEALLRECLISDHKYKNTYSIGNDCQLLGDVFLESDRPDSAFVYYSKSLSLSDSSEFFVKAGSLKGLGKIYFKRSEYNNALKCFLDAIEAGKGGRAKSVLRDVYLQMSYLYEKMNMPQKALEAHRLYFAWNDSTNILVKRNQLAYSEMIKQNALKDFQLKTEKLEYQERLRVQAIIRNGIIGVLAIVALFLVLVIKQRKKISYEKRRSDDLLLNILPPEVAEELKNKGSAEAKQFDDVTVMFTDFKGFTQISESLSPAELVAEIHTCFKAFDEIISKHGIEKIKTIGDAYMCAGGLPVVNSTHAEDVVNAALEINAFMQQHLELRKSENKAIFEIRIGIHTGPVVAGIVGLKKFAYDIWGDTVNVAARLEASGEAGKVNISGSTYQKVKDKFKCTYRGKIPAKNKGEIDMYFVE